MTNEVKPKSNGPNKGEVFIGNKNFMNYVTSVVMQLNSDIKEVRVKARGKYISRAVDVVEVTRNRFIPDAVLKDIIVGSDEFDGREGRKVRVSTIDILIARK